ncbi:unnamed protein product, partial [Mesorhabditis belari]|uniref:T-box domain-containing protein n=1 Tax=Mesorhabditis belari TaxID=2138241 RepID=A0AAF3J1G1_9BILA
MEQSAPQPPIDNQNQLYVVDGRRIRVVDLETNTIRSLTSSQLQDKTPLMKCGNDLRKFATISEIQMEWPTSISIDSSTQTLYVLDTNVIYEFKLNLEIGRVLLGSPSACVSNETSLSLNNARDIATGLNGQLYILESDGKKLNQIRSYMQNGGDLVKVAGRSSPCSCQGSSPNAQCSCDNEAKRVDAQDSLFNGPLSIAVDSHGKILIADTENAKVKCVHFPAATFDSTTSQYSIQWPFSDEVYFFNRNGLHLSTKSLITDRLLYTFSYNVDTHLGRLSQIVSPGGLLLRALWPQSDENSVAIESPSGLRSQLSFSAFDEYLESFTLPNKEVLKFHYGTGGLLLSRSGNRGMTSLGYDSFGRANFIFTKNHIYIIDPPRFEEDFSVVSVKKDDRDYLEIKSRPGEAYLGGEAEQRLLTLDEDSFEWTEENNGKILFESEVHPGWGGRAVSRARRTWPSVEHPSRRSLVWRFDWRPFSSSSSKSRRVAEVNGLNIFSIAFDRAGNFDVVRGKGEEEVLLKIEYTESGEWKQVTPGKETALASMNISYDNMGRKTGISWGSMKRSFSYDRQNRLIERNWGAGEHVFKYSYAKDASIPIQVDMPNGHKYTIKLDNFGRIQQATSPSGEVHQISMTTVPQGSLIKRRVPQSKGASLSVVNGEGDLLEWLSPDEMHHVRMQRDSRNRLIRMTLDSKFTTIFEYKNNQLSSVKADHYTQRISRQAELPIEINEARLYPECWKNTNFSLFYDDVGRIESIQGNVEGKKMTTIQWKYNKRSGFVENLAGFTVTTQGNTQSISNSKMSIESEYNKNGQLVKRKGKNENVECSMQINRDAHGRQISTEWKKPSGTFTEEIGFEGGQLAEFVTKNDERWSYKFDKDGRIWSVNGEQFEWSSGGIPRKILGTVYATDSNGWTMKKGNFTFKLDSLGRLIKVIEMGTKRMTTIQYDHLNRVISFKHANNELTFFYAFPHQPTRISHFLDSKTSLITTLLYTDDGELFAMMIGNEKYLILSDSKRTPRCIFSENQLLKEIDRSLYGGIISNSNKTFWIPVGYLGGIEIEEAGVVLLNGRPLDTLTGRWMSFGPDQMGVPKNFLDPRQTLDPCAFEENIASTKMPLDMSSWLSLARISPTTLSPSKSLLLTDATNGDSVASAIQTGFAQRLEYFSRLDSVTRSALGESLPRISTPTVTRDDPGFAELLFIIPKNDKIDVKFSPKLTAEEEKLIVDLLETAKEVQWPLVNGGWNRHFARSDSLGSRFSSTSHPHFTAVVGSDSVELRSGKTRIIVHFETNPDAVRSKLSDDLRRREAHAVWKMEKKLVEKDLPTRNAWTDDERRELLGRGRERGGAGHRFLSFEWIIEILSSQATVIATNSREELSLATSSEILDQSIHSIEFKESLVNSTFQISNLLDMQPTLKDEQKQEPQTSKEVSKVKVRLSNQNLWEKFHTVTTEMVVTKSGRKMFPKLEYLIEGMDEDACYLLTLKIVRVDDNRYKFQCGEWVPAGRGDPGFQEKQVHHNDGPMPGAHWMRAPINFENVKITNNPQDCNPKHIFLLSMHKFVPVLTIYKLPPTQDGIMFASVRPTYEEITLRLKCTEFIAVTAYQNHTITNLKIEHNPFAKGFRDGGACAPKRCGGSPSESLSPSPKRATMVPMSGAQLGALQNPTPFPLLPFAIPSLNTPLYSPFIFFTNLANQYSLSSQSLP